MFLTCVVPVYNLAALLPRCMQSLLNQRSEDYEILLVDDGSTDGSAALCDRYAAEYPHRVRVVHKPNGGLSDARNAGMLAAAGTHVTFPDPDDWVEPDYVPRALTLLGETPELVCLGYLVEYDDRTVTPAAEGLHTMTGREGQMALMAPGGMNGFAWNKCYCLKLIRRFNLKFESHTGTVEDLDFAYRYLAHCERITFDPESRVYHYCQRPDAATHAGFSQKQLDSLNTYAFILADTDDPRIAALARQELCNWAVNLTALYLRDRCRDEDAWERIRTCLGENLSAYLRGDKYSAGRKLQAVLARICPGLYGRIKG